MKIKVRRKALPTRVRRWIREEIDGPIVWCEKNGGVVADLDEVLRP